jgi:hypothetical protein
MALLFVKPNLLRHLLANPNVRHLTTNKNAAQMSSQFEMLISAFVKRDVRVWERGVLDKI